MLHQAIEKLELKVFASKTKMVAFMSENILWDTTLWLEGKRMAVVSVGSTIYLGLTLDSG